MFKFYDHCIFCSKKLNPDSTGGVGEHVIPKAIYGFWRSYDICEDCKKYFGNKVDSLAIQNVSILNAMSQLNLPDSEKLWGNLPYVGTDTIDRRKIPMRKKNGIFKIKATSKDDDFMECSENDWKTFGINWLKSKVESKVSMDDFDKEIEILKDKYEKLKHGETVRSELLNYSIRKRQTHNIEINNQSIPPLTKLISKIFIFFLFLVLSPRQIKLIRDIENIFNHARFDGEIKKNLINWCPLAQAVEYYKFHRLRMHKFAYIQVVDITLFGYLNWRIVLRSQLPILIKDTEGDELEEVQLILDFEDLENRQKYIGMKYIDENEIRYYKLIA